MIRQMDVLLSKFGSLIIGGSVVPATRCINLTITIVSASWSLELNPALFSSRIQKTFFLQSSYFHIHHKFCSVPTAASALSMTLKYRSIMLIGASFAASSSGSKSCVALVDDDVALECQDWGSLLLLSLATRSREEEKAVHNLTLQR
ncbi:hypothetical protein R1flu_015892 [Riccia fluitans]|uniref:Uncharacterized protein n=1 Tax=Riccia fluitans TaxID=41844 RepID=A0ABD1YKQ0_9MARC